MLQLLNVYLKGFDWLERVMMGAIAGALVLAIVFAIMRLTA